MKARPLLMCGDMVRATLEERKTQTRRIVKPRIAELLDGLGNPPGDEAGSDVDICYVRDQERVGDDGRKYRYTGLLASIGEYPEEGFVEVECPYGAPGDLLWVRETFGWHEGILVMRADCGPIHEATTKWKPSIFMPRWASRITLEITRIRVERLQEISEEDAKAEGVTEDKETCDHKRYSCEEVGCLGPGFRAPYMELWESLNAKRGFGWKANPWVWVVEFRKL